ncbi:Leu/Phe-tRNA protein transferase, putative [Plasmodium chabaudi chabaudi]|uniref:Leu/Phe-tRNA protein transferase, putative n=2 Tax=Plasmodium chabaudi TaxID=5825 RepID=A0A1D3LBF6_PLACU|nr:Leu/Phe-tRNA protein transferase, putative [Plasmodium chabaudi chabaudi]SCM05182.1 Leu/Phe-tRNA protein transferase, putative [Plasmodium chabaudi adami]
MRIEEMKGDEEIEDVENDGNQYKDVENCENQYKDVENDGNQYEGVESDEVQYEDDSSPENNNTISSGDDKNTNIDDNININKIAAIMSIKEPETLTKIFNLMKANNCLSYYPLLTPYHNIEKLVDMLLEENYEYENTWCVHYHASFICRLFYEGFIPVASKQKVQIIENLEPKIYKEYLLIPKIHFIRSCMHPSEIHISKKVKKKCKQFYITINKDFDGVVKGIVEKHGQNWLYPFIQEEFKKIFEKKVNYKNVQMHSVELWCEDELVAGELGNTVGSIYSSLTGFQRKSSAGTIQLCALAKLLEHQKFQLWDLGMLLPYKKEIGSKEISMKEFFERHRKFKYIDAEFKVPYTDKLNCAVLIRGVDPSDPTIQPNQPNPT